jgi:hypothetical protein
MSIHGFKTPELSPKVPSPKQSDAEADGGRSTHGFGTVPPISYARSTSAEPTKSDGGTLPTGTLPAKFAEIMLSTHGFGSVPEIRITSSQSTHGFSGVPLLKIGPLTAAVPQVINMPEPFSIQRIEIVHDEYGRLFLRLFRSK